MKTTVVFKIDAIIKMARTTANDEFREKLLDEAYDLLAEASEDMAAKSDLTDTFMEEMLIKNSGATKRSVVYAVYLEWCERKGVTPIGRNYFYNELRRRGVYARKSSDWIVSASVRGWDK